MLPVPEIDHVIDKDWYLWAQGRNPGTWNAVIKEVNACMLRRQTSPIQWYNRQGKLKSLVFNSQTNAITYCRSGVVEQVKLVRMKVIHAANYHDQPFYDVRLSGSGNQEPACVVKWEIEDGGGPNDSRAAGVWIVMEQPAQDACNAGLLAGLETVTYIHNWDARFTGLARTSEYETNLITCIQTSRERLAKRRRIRCVSVRTPVPPAL